MAVCAPPPRGYAPARDQSLPPTTHSPVCACTNAPAAFCDAACVCRWPFFGLFSKRCGGRTAQHDAAVVPVSKLAWAEEDRRPPPPPVLAVCPSTPPPPAEAALRLAGRGAGQKVGGARSERIPARTPASPSCDARGYGEDLPPPREAPPARRPLPPLSSCDPAACGHVGCGGWGAALLPPCGTAPQRGSARRLGPRAAQESGQRGRSCPPSPYLGLG